MFSDTRYLDTRTPGSSMGTAAAEPAAQAQLEPCRKHPCINILLRSSMPHLHHPSQPVPPSHWRRRCWGAPAMPMWAWRVMVYVWVRLQPSSSTLLTGARASATRCWTLWSSSCGRAASGASRWWWTRAVWSSLRRWGWACIAGWACTAGRGAGLGWVLRGAADSLCSTWPGPGEASGQ